ncbi:MAG: Ser-Thr-rich GPI-anchored membrane family protein, partial [bacterium]
LIRGNEASGSYLVPAQSGQLTWNVLSYISPGNDYKIRVIGVDNPNSYNEAGKSDLSDNYFSIVSAATAIPSITVLSPNGGEAYKTGDTVNIKWNSINIDAGKVKIELSYKHNDPTYPGGQYIEDWIIGETANAGSYLWKIPEYYANGIVASSFAIKISAAGASDYSNGKFTITLGAIKTDIVVTKPASEDGYYKGDTMPISWVSSGTDQYSISLLRKKDPSFLRFSINTFGPSPNISWKIPTDIPNADDYYIRVSEGLYRSKTGYSGVFSIKANAQPSITVLSPNGGEQWVVGKTYNIKWSANGFASNALVNVNLVDYYKNATYEIGTYPAGTFGVYSGSEQTSISWTVPSSIFDYGGTISGNYFKISVSENAKAGVSDESNSYFSIAQTISYPGFFMTTDKSNYSTGDAINLKINRADNNTFPYYVDLYVVRQSDDSKKLFYQNLNVTSPTTTQITTINSSIFTASGNYTLLVCAGGEVCGAGANTNSTAVYYFASAQPFVTVMSPNGGEKWEKGKTYTISWQSVGLEKVGIYLMDYKAGPTAIPIIPSIAVSISKYSWTVPENINLGDSSYKIDIGYNAIRDESDNYFSITAVKATDSDNSPDYTFGIPSYPVTPEKYPDLFTAGVGKGDYIGGGPCLYGTEPNSAFCKPTSDSFTTFYDHCVSLAQLNEAFVNSAGKLGALGSSPPAGYECRNGAFAPITPSITVLSPNGGETWQVGDIVQVKWQANNVKYVRIYIYDDTIFGSGSTNYVTDYDGFISADAGYFNWKIGNQLPGTSLPRKYKIRVDGVNEAILGAAVIANDSSDNYFSIVVGPTSFLIPENQLADISSALLKLNEEVNKLFGR